MPRAGCPFVMRSSRNCQTRLAEAISLQSLTTRRRREARSSRMTVGACRSRSSSSRRTLGTLGGRPRYMSVPELGNSRGPMESHTRSRSCRSASSAAWPSGGEIPGTAVVERAISLVRRSLSSRRVRSVLGRPRAIGAVREGHDPAKPISAIAFCLDVSGCAGAVPMPSLRHRTQRGDQNGRAPVLSGDGGDARLCLSPSLPDAVSPERGVRVVEARERTVTRPRRSVLTLAAALRRRSGHALVNQGRSQGRVERRRRRARGGS
jgi:hypothetical protein